MSKKLIRVRDVMKPEFDMVEQVITVAPGKTTRVSGALHRVIDSLADDDRAFLYETEANQP